MIGIIGTAGRDKTKPMTRKLWDLMVEDAMKLVPVGSELVSGGAAWADHLAVELMLRGHASKLKLHLPAPFDIMFDGFIGPRKGSGSTANYYHYMFTKVIGVSSIDQIHEVLGMQGVSFTVQPPKEGYSGMFARNQLVARDSKRLLAYTFGQGIEPDDGGTLNTWKKCSGERVHRRLPVFYVYTGSGDAIR